MPIILSGERVERAILSLLIDKHSQCLSPDEIITPSSATPPILYISVVQPRSLPCVDIPSCQDYKPYIKLETDALVSFWRGINDNALNKAMRKIKKVLQLRG